MSEVEVKVWRVEPQAPSRYLLVLHDDNRRILPMAIGLCEAASIQSVLRREHGFRQAAGTHDLLEEMITRLGGRLTKVVIDDLWNEVYFAKLHISTQGEIITVDARPSDAVAIALRAQAPLYATGDVMDAATGELQEQPHLLDEGEGTSDEP